MLMIPIHVIAFFMAIMMVPEDVNQFTIAVHGKEIQWTRQETGWHAVELPRDDWGTYSVKGSEVTISGEGREMKTNINRFLTLPEDLDWKKVAEIQVALKSLGDPVQIQRQDGKIVLSQAKGELFEKPVTITWNTPDPKRDSVVGDTELQEAVTLAVEYFRGYLLLSKRSGPGEYRVIAAQNLLTKGLPVWRITFKPTTMIPKDPDKIEFWGGEVFVTVDLPTKQCTLAHGE